MSPSDPDRATERNTLLHKQRKQLRDQLVAAREALTASEHQRLSIELGSHLDRLLQQLKPTTVAFCWPFRKEPDLTQFFSNWLAADRSRKAALPVVVDAEKTLRFRTWQPGMQLVPDRYGIPSPQSGDWIVPQILIIPLNGFDSRGYRLGYGAGYFDRTLAGLSPKPITVGVGFELGRLLDLPEAPHDYPMDWVVTEAGCVVTPDSKPR